MAWRDDPLAWLRDRGGTASVDLVTAVGEHGGGLFTTRAVAAGTRLLTVPASLMLMASEEKGEDEKELHEGCRLCLRLLAERTRGADSRLHGWIESLPTLFDTPLHWPEEQLPALGCPLLIAQVTEERETLRQLIAALQSKHHPSLDAASYLWAYSIVQSRGFSVVATGDGETRWALVPVADFLNHAAEANVDAEWSAEEQAYTYTARRDLARMDELFITYGRHDDALLLSQYGFLLADNPHARVRLALVDDGATAAGADASEGSTDVEGDAEWLEQNDLADADLRALDAAAEPTFELLCALRLRHATAAERQQGAAFRILEGEVVSAANEARVRRDVRALVGARLQALALGEVVRESAAHRALYVQIHREPSSHPDDAVPAERQRLAREWRSGQRRLLQAALAALDGHAQADVSALAAAAAAAAKQAPRKCHSKRRRASEL